MALATGFARAHPSPARPPKCEAGDDRRASLQPTRHPLETRSWRAGRPDSKFPASRLSRANQKRSRGTERNVTVPRVVTKEAGQMSSATPVAGTPGAVSAESLLEKYNLPEGTNADAIARVMARLGDLPVSSAEKPRGDPAGGDPGAARSGGARVDASARRNQMRFTSGGEPVARVSWSPASPGGTARKSNGRHAGPDSPTTPGGDPLALIQDLYGDDVEETVRASANARSPRPGTARRSRRGRASRGRAPREEPPEAPASPIPDSRARRARDPRASLSPRRPPPRDRRR